MDVRYDFSDVDKALEAFEGECVAQMRVVADEAVQHAKENGSYRDITGRLRRSNRAEVTKEGVTLINDAPYASFVESKGREVLTGSALFLERRLKEEFE